MEWINNSLSFLSGLWSILVLIFNVLKSVISAAFSLVRILPNILDFLNELPLYVPNFVVVFLLAGVAGNIILLILARRS